MSHDGPTLRDPAPGEENEEDVEGMKQHTKVYQARQSIPHAMPSAWLVRRKRPLDALLTGWVVNQKLANPERHLDVAKGHSQHADDRTDELKRLNRSIFRPVITFNKDAKRAAQEAKALTYGSREEEIGAGPNVKRAAQPSRSATSLRRLHPTTSWKMNSTTISTKFSDVEKTLKALGTALGQELDHQNNRIERIEDKTVNLDNRVFRNTEVHHSMH
ncbi:hypothetical protein EDB85DRAFT_2170035 [Lactarius pseudohatsudake]|nr:hypothetical protein EDB85DRAFT_2170035 [Lactarius pseudohatsudake]